MPWGKRNSKEEPRTGRIPFTFTVKSYCRNHQFGEKGILIKRVFQKGTEGNWEFHTEILSSFSNIFPSLFLMTLCYPSSLPASASLSQPPLSRLAPREQVLLKTHAGNLPFSSPPLVLCLGSLTFIHILSCHQHMDEALNFMLPNPEILSFVHQFANQNSCLLPSLNLRMCAYPGLVDISTGRTPYNYAFSCLLINFQACGGQLADTVALTYFA